jgi:hypothetical protein
MAMIRCAIAVTWLAGMGGAEAPVEQGCCMAGLSVLTNWAEGDVSGSAPRENGPWLDSSERDAPESERSGRRDHFDARLRSGRTESNVICYEGGQIRLH